MIPIQFNWWPSFFPHSRCTPTTNDVSDSFRFSSFILVFAFFPRGCRVAMTLVTPIRPFLFLSSSLSASVWLKFSIVLDIHCYLSSSYLFVPICISVLLVGTESQITIQGTGILILTLPFLKFFSRSTMISAWIRYSSLAWH
jgi:hypothetical protein